MIYLDYAANTPVDDKVLDIFIEGTKKYTANPNSNHKLGLLAKNQITISSKEIAGYFKCDEKNIIYTSGSSESNNLVIKGVAYRNKNIGNHIIISAVEHSSIVAPCNFLSSLGFDVTVVPLKKNGLVDLNFLKKNINDKTILVSICSVDSELGTVQPISEIVKIIKKYPNCLFHTDATQAIGKVSLDYTGVDFITFAPHKFFGLNGFGVLLNLGNNKIVPLIHGGKSTTIFRSGTPVAANVMALAMALKIAFENLETRYMYVKKLNSILREGLKKYDFIVINSPEKAIPHILNISFKNLDAKEVIKKLEEKDIFVSSATACSMNSGPSKSVFSITNDEALASNTIRISLSYLNKVEDIKKFLKELDTIINKKLLM